MIIHHYHPETLEYLGEGQADESPLEPGVFLIPAHATDAAPPAEVAGKTRHFEGGAWVLRDIPPPPAPPVKTPAEVAAEEQAAIRAKLAEIDFAGIRSIREYIAAKADAPKILKDLEAAAVAERAKLK